MYGILKMFRSALLQQCFATGEISTKIIRDTFFIHGMKISHTTALVLAAGAHSDQKRKNGEPYILHPIRVMRNLLMYVPEQARADTPWAEVALLHDVVEDTDVTEVQMRTYFDAATVDAVMEVTDDQTLSKGERKRAQLRSAPHKSQVARWVKMADMLDNLSDRLLKPDTFSAEANAAYFGWKYAVFRAFVLADDDKNLAMALAGVFRAAKTSGLWTDADATPEALERYFVREDART